MQYTTLGRTGLKVSRLCLGTMNFGWLTNEADSFAIMDKALDDGINFFDTADIYGAWADNGYPGLTEDLMGRWFAQGGGRREKVVLATKAYNQMGDWPNESKLSALHIKRACEASLKRLKTDHIDLYQMHHIDRDTPWEEIWQAMEQLVQEGKVLYVGSSNFAGWNIAQANEIAKNRNFLGIVSEQSLYNLVVRDVEMEVIPACLEYGVGLIPWSPVNRGVLAGALKKANVQRMKHEGTRLIEEGALHQQLEQYEAFCDELGANPAAVALAWLLHQPVVTAPITGPRTMDHVDISLQALDIKFTDEQLTRLEEIWPGKKTSPEEYAW
jgi:aryl-alcohol dehydrogenase-like predicted oxidoreductase